LEHAVEIGNKIRNKIKKSIMKHFFLDIKLMLTHVTDLVLLAIGGIHCALYPSLSPFCPM
jgi:hypothetical protein